jgi:hypothetical protein
VATGKIEDQALVSFGAEIADREIEPPFLTIGVVGETDHAGLRNALQPRSDIDASPSDRHRPLDDVAQ